MRFKHRSHLFNLRGDTYHILCTRLHGLARHIRYIIGGVSIATHILQPEFACLKCEPINERLPVIVIILGQKCYTFTSIVNHLGEKYLTLRNVGFGHRPKIAC